MNFYEKIEENLNDICFECKFYNTPECIPSKCNIGFAKNAAETAKVKGNQYIEDGLKMIPKNDTKLYNKTLIAKSIASICRVCKECNLEHNDNCIISLARKSLEITYLQEDVIFPGSTLMYIVNVAKQDQGLADEIKEEYDKLLKESTEEVAMDKSLIAKKTPILVDLKENETYLWCSCGKSSNIPFCNGAHIGTDFVPLSFVAKKTGKAKLCACNHTKTPPYCDGSHLKL